MSSLHVICGHTSRDNPEPVPGGGAENTLFLLGLQQPRAGWTGRLQTRGPTPTPPHGPAWHIPGETVDLLHVEATGGAVS